MRKRKFTANEQVNDVFIVETICKKKTRSNKEPLYFIKWKDWDDKYNTWEPQSNILDKSLIDIFEEEQRAKQKLKKENSKIQELEIPKELESKNLSVEVNTDVEISKNKLLEKQDNEEKLKKSNNETESRPKICLKILKHRIHVPNLKITEKTENCLFEQDPDKSKKSSNIEDDWKFSSKFSPNYFTNNEEFPIKPTNDHSFRNSKLLSHRTDYSWNKNFDCSIRKPRKLLSINEYSAKMKKHHKKSKQDKLKSEEKKMKYLPYQNQKETNVENIEEQKIEVKSVRSQHEGPLLSLENQIENWSKKPVEKETFTEQPLKDEEIKSVVERFKYHANTIVTDVTIRNLTVTIREMPYEDFVDSDTSRYLSIRVPIESEWFTRYRGVDDQDDDTNNDSDVEKVCEIIEGTQDEVSVKSDSKQKLMDKFAENIIPGLRPPSRPRSVDSYKTAIDKNFSETVSKKLFSVISPQKTPTDCQLPINIVSQIPNKSPLQVTVDDCEEVDVVGGIESDHSFVGSLQSETVTMSREIRQSLPINSNPVPSIIQSLLQSYSYNHSMMMPPLQAAPWMENQIPNSQLYQISHHNNAECINNSNNNNINNNNNLISNNSCLSSRTFEPNILKFSENTCLSLYRQPSNMSDIYLNSAEDVPIDLSFK